MTKFAYPAAHTGSEQRNQPFVQCECGHRSYGTYFESVWSEQPNDVWYQHRLHMDTLCPQRRVPQTDSRKLRSDEALAEIEKILERVK